MARFRIRRHWRPFGARYTVQLLADNGEALCSTEPYVSEANARRGIDAVRRAAATAEVQLADGEVIGTGDWQTPGEFA